MNDTLKDQMTDDERAELNELRKEKLKKRLQSALGFYNTSNWGSCLEAIEDAQMLCKRIE